MISYVISVDFLRQDWCVVIANLSSSRGHKNNYSRSLVWEAFVLTMRLAFQLLQAYAIGNSKTVSTSVFPPSITSLHTMQPGQQAKWNWERLETSNKISDIRWATGLDVSVWPRDLIAFHHGSGLSREKILWTEIRTSILNVSSNSTFTIWLRDLDMLSKDAFHVVPSPFYPF